jgi:competence ComEA-like helix-hairpin-helix protein
MLRIDTIFRMLLLTAFVYFAFVASAQTLPPGKAKEIVQQQCGGCHALKVVTTKRATKEQWAVVVDQMVGRGADVPDDEIETLVDYLAKSFGPTKAPSAIGNHHARNHLVNINKATATELAGTLGLSTKEASAIVAYRKQNGDFKAWRDLMNVPGVDTREIETVKDRLTF